MKLFNSTSARKIYLPFTLRPPVNCIEGFLKKSALRSLVYGASGLERVLTGPSALEGTAIRPQVRGESGIVASE